MDVAQNFVIAELGGFLSGHSVACEEEIEGKDLLEVFNRYFWLGKETDFAEIHFVFVAEVKSEEHF